MTLEEYAQHIADKTGKSDAESVAIIKRFVARQYEAIYNSAPWREANILVQQTATGAQIILPNQVERPSAVRWDAQTIGPAEPHLLFAIDPQIFERTGTPITFTHLQASATAVLPDSEVLTLVSDSGSDTTTRVLIRGELGGIEQYEVVTLNGTTPVDTINSYD